MKFVSILATTLVSAVALAYPTLKDTATFQGTFYGGAGGSIEFTQTIELVSFDAAASKYTLKNTVVYNGQSNVQNAEVASDDLLSNAKVAGILTNCAQMGGTPEVLNIPAGQFNTCMVPQDRGSQIWVADAPFGFVKEIYIDEEGNRTEATMTSFSHGQ